MHAIRPSPLVREYGDRNNTATSMNIALKDDHNTHYRVITKT